MVLSLLAISSLHIINDNNKTWLTQIAVSAMARNNYARNYVDTGYNDKNQIQVDSPLYQ